MLSIIFIGLLLMLGTVEAATSDLPQQIKVKENQNPGTVVVTVEVTGNNFPKLILVGDILKYIKVVDNPSCTNTASCNKFDLVTIKEIDREKVPNGFVLFTPEFMDGSVGGLCALIILDENDNVPVFGSQCYKATIPEDFPVNNTIPNLQITAIDADYNPIQEYSLIPAGQNSKGIEDYMKIDKYKGVITVVKALDYETRNFLNIQYKYLMKCLQQMLLYGSKLRMFKICHQHLYIPVVLRKSRKIQTRELSSLQ
ncbi:protocadherin gamma-A1-like isoform X2 [Octopus sinensis]|nr:protocadherin gamma-A1-like isoform X2 [Octopus sinensis]